MTSIGKCYPGRAPAHRSTGHRRATRSRAGRRSCSRSCASSRPEVVLLVGGMAHRFAFGPGRAARRARRQGAGLGGGTGRIGPVPAAPIRCVDLAERPRPGRALAAGDRRSCVTDGQALGRDARASASAWRSWRRSARWSSRCSCSGRSVGPGRRSTRSPSRRRWPAATRPRRGGARSSTWPAGTPSSTPTAPATTAGRMPAVAWLQRDCPLRVLLPEQPDDDVTQEELLRDGLRLAAPLGSAFPSRAEPTGPNLRGQQLVFVGHFADAAAASCVPDRVEPLREHVRGDRLRRARPLTRRRLPGTNLDRLRSVPAASWTQIRSIGPWNRSVSGGWWLATSGRRECPA